MDSYKIGEIAKELGIKIDTIRYYEKIGLIPKPKRLENGYRVYSEKHIYIIKFIISSKNFGFTLKEIKKVLGILTKENDTKSINSYHNKLLNYKISFQNLTNSLYFSLWCLFMNSVWL